MVLKSKYKIISIIFIFHFFFVSSVLYAQNEMQQDSFWIGIFQTAFLNNTRVTDLLNEYQSSLIKKKQYDYSWVPVIQTGIQNNFNFKRSDYINILNQTQNIDSEHTLLLSPVTSVSIIQKLPGNGQVSLTADYAFSYLTERNLFIQYPSLELSFNQGLSRGTFGITKDPELLLLQEQMQYSRMVLDKNLFEEFKYLIMLISETDFLCAQEDYYEALVKQYESEANTTQEKNESGLRSNLETFYAVHQYVNSQDSLSNIIFEKNEKLKELRIIIPDYNCEIINTRKNELRESILKTLEKFVDYTQEEQDAILASNLDSLIYESVLKQYKFQYQNDDKQSSPILYLSSSLSTDNNFNYAYSDWFKSFRVLNQRPYPVNFSFVVGIYKSFELPKAKTLRKEIYNLYCDSIKKERQMNQTSQKNELTLLLNQIKSDSEYMTTLEQQLTEEETFRNERMTLFSQGLITSNDFYKSETMYYLIYSDYVKTFWKTINNQLKVIEIYGANKDLMNELLGGIYEKLF